MRIKLFCYILYASTLESRKCMGLRGALRVVITSSRVFCVMFNYWGYEKYTAGCEVHPK